MRPISGSATEAGFSGVRKVPIGGVPAVFGVLDGRRGSHRGHLFHVRPAVRSGRWLAAALEGRISSIIRSAARSAAAARSTRRSRAPSSPRCTRSRRRARGCRSTSSCSPKGRRKSARPISGRVRGCRRARGDAPGERGHHPLGVAQRRGDDQSRRQGNDRVRADSLGERWAAGPRATSIPASRRRSTARLASGRSLVLPGDPPWQPAGDRRLARACPRADAARARADRRVRRDPQRGGGQAHARRPALDRTTPWRELLERRPRSRRSGAGRRLYRARRQDRAARRRGRQARAPAVRGTTGCRSPAKRPAPAFATRGFADVEVNLGGYDPTETAGESGPHPRPAWRRSAARTDGLLFAYPAARAVAGRRLHRRAARLPRAVRPRLWQRRPRARTSSTSSRAPSGSPAWTSAAMGFVDFLYELATI